jgi:hypothetical protein
MKRRREHSSEIAARLAYRAWANAQDAQVEGVYSIVPFEADDGSAAGEKSGSTGPASTGTAPDSIDGLDPGYSASAEYATRLAHLLKDVLGIEEDDMSITLYYNNREGYERRRQTLGTRPMSIRHCRKTIY